MPSAQYYIAIVAPPEINEKVQAWKEYFRDRFGCVVALKSPAHLTLIPPFWMDVDQEDRLIQDIKDFSRGRETFPVELENFGAFKPRVIYIGVDLSPKLSVLQHELSAHISRLNYPIKPETRPYHPHMTLANRDLQKSDFDPAWDHFRNKKYAVAFPVKGISLLKHDRTRWNVVFTSTF